ncbi:MarR family winged helix-turn-helix transcriptional regulator [Vibrio algarum]|uniref:Winged helix DNA-binding protein n=1 Tax=Vibrio algarum TaxID=3020714 RepID=A0ABT4YYF8_9VIBR|nr:HTH domain-containing protein [Vibrio sp. KJ40-1]MDB1125983.1 winged helix DNA-binding protein [Vibrio sp. KJ40-1]
MSQAKFIETLGVVDLISEKHKQLRQITMERIGQRFEVRFSEMDIYLISLNQDNPMSLSESARFMNISRQAVHKHAKHLTALGFIQLVTSEANRRDKVIKLTQAGQELSIKINDIKSELEAELDAELGSENYDQIRTLFRGHWKLRT